MQVRSVCVIVALTIAALAVPAGADSQRPLKGSLEGHDEYGLPCGDGLGITITSTATGTITHLGQAEMISPVCLGWDGNVIGTWPFTFRAANGDEVHGFVTSWAFTDYGFDLFATITGGTGRFSDAAGELTFPTVSDGSGVWTSDIEGWISY